MQVAHLLRVPIGKPTLYMRFPIRKLFQSYQPPPYALGQAEGWYYFNPPNQGRRKYRGGGEAAPEICQVIFQPYNLTF